MSKVNLLNFFLVFIFMGCANTYKLEKKSVLNFTESYYSSWFSGVKGGGSGFNVFLKMDENNNLDIKIEGVYFKEKYASLKSQGLGKYQAFIKENGNSDKLEFDKGKEVKSLEIKDEKTPFSLNENEAVISYLVNKKLKYTKIILAKKKTLDIPM